jgi:hypothetical protein
MAFFPQEEFCKLDDAPVCVDMDQVSSIWSALGSQSL